MNLHLRGQKRRRGRRLECERLEERLVPASFYWKLESGDPVVDPTKAQKANTYNVNVPDLQGTGTINAVSSLVITSSPDHSVYTYTATDAANPSNDQNNTLNCDWSGAPPQMILPGQSFNVQANATANFSPDGIVFSAAPDVVCVASPLDLQGGVDLSTARTGTFLQTTATGPQTQQVTYTFTAPTTISSPTGLFNQTQENDYILIHEEGFRAAGNAATQDYPDYFTYFYDLVQSAPPPPPPTPPTVSSLSVAVGSNFVPNSSPGSSGLAETITGANFESGATVSFGDLAVSNVHVVDSTTITCTVSGLAEADEGFRTVTVTNPDGGKASLSGDQGFYVTSLTIYPDSILDAPLEINQGVPIEPTSTLAAVAEHATVVRVDVQCNGTAALAQSKNPILANAQLLVFRDGQEFETKKPDQNGFQVLPLSTPPSLQAEATAADTLNFTFTPSELQAGDYTFQFELDPYPKGMDPTGGSLSDTSNLLTTTRSLAFQESTGLMNVAVMFDLSRADNTPARRNSFLNYFNYVRDMYPISADRVNVTVVPTTTTFGATNDVEVTLQALRAYYNQQLQYSLGHGLTPYTQVVLFTDNPTLASSGDLGASDLYVGSGLISPSSLVSTIDYATVAHEVGHLLKLGDTYAPPIVPSANNPRKPGAPANGNPVDPGNFDLFNHTVSVPGKQLADFMGNDNNPDLRWIDVDTWNYLYTIFNRAPAPASVGVRAALASEAQVIVSGTIAANGQATFDPFLPFTGAPVAPPSGGGSYSLELLDASGKVLSTTNFEPLANPFLTTGDLPFSFTIPYSAGTARFVLLNNGTVLASRAVPVDSPTVQITSPSGSVSLSGVVNIAWTGSEPDGAPLTYTVLYSTDGGATWVPIAVNLTQESYAWDTSFAPGTKTGAIMVVANNGIEEGSAVSTGSLSLATLPTTVTILAPAAGSAVATGTPVLLQGIGFDPQNGLLADSSLTWSDSVAGMLGTGGTISAELSAGTHQITLTGTDKSGKQVQATETITAGNQPGTITGTVFQDVNNTGTFDGKEPTSAGVTVFLDVKGTGTLATGDPMTQTNAQGAYTFTNVAAGPNLVEVVAPSGYASAPIIAQVPPGGAAAATDFPLDLAIPTVASIAPATGPTAGGTSVTITGTNLANASEIDFGTTKVTNFSSDTATSLTFNSPAVAAAGTVHVHVVTAAGTSPTSNADQFTYTSPPANQNPGGSATGATSTGGTSTDSGTGSTSTTTTNTSTPTSTVTLKAPALVKARDGVASFHSLALREATAGAVLHVRLTAGRGTFKLKLAGVKIVGNNSRALSITGSVAAVDKALARLSLTLGKAHGKTPVTILVSDGKHSQQVKITVQS